MARKLTTHAPFQIVRLGRKEANDQVRQAVASVTLEGLRPSKRSVQLAHFVAVGQISSEQAIEALRGYYARRA